MASVIHVSKSKYRFEKGAYEGTYSVYLESRFLGKVRKAEKTYEIENPITIKGWHAILSNTYIPIGSSGVADSIIYRTRELAAEALEREARDGGS
jgi:hypothetical protein